MEYSDELTGSSTGSEFTGNTTGSEFNFTGRVLTLADLERAAVRETHEPLSDGARESWEYFGFDRDCEWKAVLTGSEAILITDESRALNMADVHPDIDSFILWLEGSHEERAIEAEKERLFQERQIDPTVSQSAEQNSESASEPKAKSAAE